MVHTEKKLHNTQTALGAEKKFFPQGETRKERMPQEEKTHWERKWHPKEKVWRKENMLKKTRVKKNDVGKAETKLKSNMLRKFSCWRK